MAQELEFQPWSAADVVNIHSRLSSDFPLTPYVSWCNWVHKQRLRPQEKIDRILSWAICPQDYDNPTLFAYDYQLFKLLGKYRETDKLSDSQITAAHDAFKASELKCYDVNKYFFQHGGMPVNDSIMHRARKTVEYILGDIDDLFSSLTNMDKTPDVDGVTLGRKFDPRIHNVRPIELHLSENYPKSRFGPGSSSAGTELFSALGEKVVCGTSTGRHKYMSDWWVQRGDFGDVTLVPGDYLCFVPKKVKIARAVLPGPSMNMRSQLAVGDYLKERLKAVVGVDLRNQMRNRSLAKLGSLTDSYCTVDLSAASDTISYSIVMSLLPKPWFDFLDTIRSHRYYDPIDKKWKEYAKFSAMGNGFTFELETAIFYSIVEATIFCSNDSCPIDRREIAVYGDDMIFPKEYYHVVCQSLVGCGFSVNLEKSFASGPFRESCGGDYFNGFLVTPYKLEVINEITDAINFHNGLFDVACRLGAGGCPCPRFSRALDFIYRRLHRDSNGLISYGYPEKLWNRDIGDWVFQSSGRFLWSNDLINCPNTFFSRLYQSMQPMHLVLKKDVIASRGSGRDRVYVDYDVHIKVARYICSFGGKPPTLSKATVEITRNRCDQLLSKKDRALIRRRSAYVTIV